MKNILLLIVILGFFGCSEENINTTPLTYDHFQNNLKPEMNYTALVDFFGEPTKDIGSGIHIYVYELSDSTEIWIGYVDEILYARHLDEKGQLLDTII
ncbi:MAG: hypothetical protein OEW67_07405 [Cyclobacteriaceae bacterium]|nr:hypothetical protein [Cyclobacteriaceae bacterium]